MTRFRLAGRRVAIALSALGAEALAFALVTVAATAAVLLSVLAPAGGRDAAVARVTLPPVQAAALVEATSGAASGELQAVGQEARLINAALPYSSAPLQSARPFEIDGDGLDHRRALLCLTQAVYYEAGFEPLAGRRAVAQVVLNRMRHPAFPKSVCGVVYQGARQPVCQFSFVCDGSLYRRPAAAAWRSAQEIARAALDGYVERSVGAATHYHADYVAPRWAPMLSKIAKLGTHIFYRWPGAWGQRSAFTGRYVGEPHDPLALRPPLREDLAGTPLAQAVESGPITDGTVLKRAPNDVGGLLDVSKGWTLNIPAPNEVGSAASRAVAEQEGKKAAAEPSIEPARQPLVASR